MKIITNYNYKNYENNYSTNFKHKIPRQIPETIKQAEPAVKIGALATVLINLKNIFSGNKVSKTKTIEETVPVMPTKENILSELEEPFVIEGITVLDPKTKNLKFDTKLLDEVIKDKCRKADYMCGNGKYNEIHINKNDETGGYSIIFCHPSKNAIRDAMYQIKIRPNGEVRYISKALHFVFNEKCVLSKIINITPGENSKIYYSHADDEIGVEYMVDETGKAEIIKYHNPNAEDLPNCMKFPYDGEINDEAMIKAFSKLY